MQIRNQRLLVCMGVYQAKYCSASGGIALLYFVFPAPSGDDSEMEMVEF
jgi:hypothetical protein